MDGFEPSRKTKSYGPDKLRCEEAEEKIKLKQYVSLRFDCFLLYVVGRMFSSVEKSRFLMSSLNKPVSSTTLEHYILY
jgi:hypothetical protein